jgi:hypothetical protein
MFKVKNNIATREFLQKAYHCEGVTEYYRKVIRSIMRNDPFAESYHVDETIILAAYNDEDYICDDWADRIKAQFRIEKDDKLFEFGKEFKLTDMSFPLRISHGLSEPYEKYKGKCLVLQNNYELIAEKVGNYTILKFKKK